MAVSFLSSFFYTLFPSSKSSCPRPTPTCLHCFPSQLRLQQSSSGWSSLVSASHLTQYSSSFSSLHARDYSHSHILYPALAYSNILFFKSAYNVQIIVSENEPEGKLLKRFRKEVLNAGVFQECNKRRFFENPRDKKKRKSREAAKRNQWRRARSRAPIKKKAESPKKRKFYEEKDDNWELPEIISLIAEVQKNI